MKKILFIFGTRPEAIKTIPIIKEFQRNSNNFKVEVCITAQHREMLDSVMQFFNCKANYDLNIMKKNQGLSELTSNILTKLDDVLSVSKPDLVFVHGDTTTTFTASLSAFYHQIPVAHIEAGLRTNNIYSPFPEEINRQLVSKIAKYHFTPTDSAKDALLKENIDKSKIYVVGNSVIDALRLALQKIENDKELKKQIEQKLNNSKFNIHNSKFILITGHRRENLGVGFLNICNSIKELALKYKDVDFVYPVHLNPKVREPVNKILSDLKNVHLIEPLDYPEFVYLMSKSYLVLTDSGGIQEEAPSLGKPVLVMRENSERPEALKAGTAKLVGTTQIVENVSLLLENHQEYLKMSKAINPYGSGDTSKKILEVIKNVS